MHCIQNISSHNDIDHSTLEGSDPAAYFPVEIFLQILSYLNKKELGKCNLVSRQWKIIASDDIFVKALYAFSKRDWALYFGVIVDEPPLPPNMHKLLRSRPDFLKGQSMEETHMLVLIPSSVDGKPLTLNSMSAFVTSPLQGHKCNYLNIWDAIAKEDGVKPANTSYWVLMSKEVLPGSRNQNYPDQQKQVKEYAKISHMEYRIPNALEAVVCICTEFVKSGKRFYSDDSGSTSTRCQEAIQDSQVTVGNFSAEGLCVHYYYNDSESLGVSVLQQF